MKFLIKNYKKNTNNKTNKKKQMREGKFNG